MATNNNNNNSDNSVAKKTKGKQKIEMKKIEKEGCLMPTFSKRRWGICMKASELVTLTGSEVGFLIFSPGGKPFTFGNPSFEDLANRYMGHQPEPQLPYDPEIFRRARIEELNHTLSELLDSVEKKKKEEMVLHQKLEGKRLNNWWNRRVEEVQMNEISGLKGSYLELLERIDKRRTETRSHGNNSACIPSSSSSGVAGQSQNMAPMNLIQNYPIGDGIEDALDHLLSSPEPPPADAFDSNP
ncbi:unnamed protein product [Linum trigynum]|uniref:MADS-box domain-containing protein n=1 Tax=Linum trigynum TaxID=586398 RepID=A0AAV2FZ85_9ROSI